MLNPDARPQRVTQRLNLDARAPTFRPEVLPPDALLEIALVRGVLPATGGENLDREAGVRRPRRVGNASSIHR